MVSELKNIEFHDMPVKSLLIDFISSSVVLTVKEYNEEKQDYFEINLSFDFVSNFCFQKIDSIEINEIYDCSLTQKDDVYFIEFTMLTTSPFISCVVSFYFKEVRVSFKDDADW